MKRKFMSIIMAMTLVFVSIGFVNASQEGELVNDNKFSVSDNNVIEKTSIDFIKNCMSDFIAINDADFSNLDENATILKKLIIDKKHIFEESDLFKKMHLVKSKINIKDIEVINKNLVEVKASELRYYIDNTYGENLNAGEEITYRLHLNKKENGDWKVIAGISSEYTSAALFNFSQYDAEAINNINLYEQYKDSKRRFTYRHSVGQVKLFLKEQFNNNKLLHKLEKDNQDVELTVHDTFNRSHMTGYQNHHWDSAPMYESDCTNYISNIIKVGNARMDNEGSYRWFWFSKYVCSRTWTAAVDLRKYLLRDTELNKGPYGTTVSRFRDLKQGDIIQMRFPSGNNHSVAVHTAGGDPIVTAHTNKYKGYFSSRYNREYVQGSLVKIHLIGFAY